MKNARTNITFQTSLIGLLLIAAGIFFISFNSGLLPYEWKPIIISWQMLLIAIGVVQISRRSITSGAILMLVGTFFLLPKLQAVTGLILPANFTHSFWPFLLILLGILVIFHGINGPWCCHHRKSISGNSCHAAFVGNEPEMQTDKDGFINYRFFFSGVDQVFLEPVFKGGSIETTFGGAKLDLRRTSLPEGTTTLYVNSTFGGVELYIPHTWNVEIQNQCIAGGFDDHRRLDYSQIDQSRKLRIVARCTFGGGEIK